jgi:hypothetical protein
VRGCFGHDRCSGSPSGIFPAYPGVIHPDTHSSLRRSDLPRTFGWFGEHATTGRLRLIFPACTGVVRRTLRVLRIRRGLPRTYGGNSKTCAFSCRSTTLSLYEGHSVADAASPAFLCAQGVARKRDAYRHVIDNLLRMFRRLFVIGPRGNEARVDLPARRVSGTCLPSCWRRRIFPVSVGVFRVISALWLTK